MEVAIKFSALDDIVKATFLTCHDSSYANLTNGGSQGGHIIFLLDSYMNVAPVSWRSKRLQRVVKSMLGAETLSLVDVLLKHHSGFNAEIFHKDEAVNQGTRNTECVTDNHSLFDVVHSTTALADKRLCVDMAVLRE